MKIIEQLNAIDKNIEVGVVVGNFDGVHVGHQRLLKSILEDCKKEKLELVVVTFVPHPLQILSPANHTLLNSYKDRRALLSEQGVNYLCEIDFTRDFSTLSPTEFLERFLKNAKSVKKIYLGHDFHFGANKAGGIKIIDKFCQENKINFKQEKEFKFKNSNVSSTVIRKKISQGEIEQVSELLGRNFFITGNIIKGDGRGKKIGFPTANIDFFHDRLIPKRGVYITQTMSDGMIYNSVTNIGFHPTFNESKKLIIETHILDFDLDIYGEDIVVYFMKYIREEKKFTSVNDLIKQINLDITTTEKYYKQ